MHSICYDYAPSSFDDIFFVNNQKDNYYLRTRAMYRLPNVQIENFRKSPIYSLPYTWNNAGDVTFHTNKMTFQISLKNLLLNDLYDNQRLYNLPEWATSSLSLYLFNIQKLVGFVPPPPLPTLCR